MIDLCHARDAREVGGKAAGLGALLRAQIVVPTGFVLPAADFERFLEASGRARHIDRVRRRARADDPAATADAADLIATWLRDTPVPADLIEALHARVRSTPVVVRSSAVGEDGQDRSFAGQLDSFLGVSSDTLVERVRDCWISMYGARSLAYQHATGTTLRRMGVVIQPEIEGAVSGVCFTRSPADPTRMRIEHVQGGCEALVSGASNPVCLEVGSSTPSSPWLPEAQVIQMIGVFRQIEALFGGPQDIEWTFDHAGQLHILQSRPITPERRPMRDAEVTVYANANINENYPDPVTPLLQSIAKTSYQHYFRNIAVAYGFAPRRIGAMDEALSDLIGVHGQRLYYNVSNLHAVLRMAPFGETFAAWFNSFVGVEATTEPRRRDLTWGRGTTGRLADARELARIAVEVTRSYRTLDAQVRVFEGTVSAYAERSTPPALRALDTDGLFALFSDFMQIRRFGWTGPGLADGACMLCCGALEHYLSSHFEEPGDVLLHGLLRGLPDIVSSEPPRQLWVLSRILRADPTLRTLFDQSTPEVLLTLGWDGERLRSSHPFAPALQRFLDDWGFRCTGELMLTVDSFQEKPEAVIDMLRAYATMEGDGPDEVIARQASARIAQTEQLAGRLSRPSRPGFRLLLRGTAGSLALRERARLKQALLYRRLRRVVLALGGRLHTAGALDEVDDIFHLSWTELLTLQEGWAAPSRSITSRKGAFAEQKLWPAPPPRLLLSRDQRWTPGEQAPPDLPTGDLLEGLAAAGGQVTARASVARGQEDFHRVAAGDVLVAPQTDPGWATVLFLVRGLVMERGGMLSHGAIIAREFGIPSVVAVDRATERIPHGTVVTVDGDRGHVHLR